MRDQNENFISSVFLKHYFLGVGHINFYTTESLFLLCKVLQAIINKYCFGNEIYKRMQTGQSQNIADTLPTCCQLLATS